ncbi:helix-turn-helix domain-containing protein [Brachybacterium sp. sponge]|uniref:helix-turn-helix domain-containing protein n=1 Tax=Brachybacterium sp. sponge TaxID=1775432 RepID=UPI0007A3C3D1|nr:helix-turn-helix domain-containing protein [Brachybacterium sp. sponge]
MNTAESDSPTLRRRFVPLDAVAEMFSISQAQAYALVRSGELRAIKVGGRGQWRIETDEIESYIERSYANAASETETVDTSDSAN